ncbi:FAD-dependent monooxygenase [Streptomyces sp. ODS28]|uniref:FAD-dependent monooxygenase n=1 Tax=Streptomyces sp. ODS28 TaxID=3136688 RepID=UPI0031EFEF10
MGLNSVKGDSGGIDVVIVGAGPTGLVLAVDLLRRGVRVRLLERGERLFPGSRGKGIQPRTREVLDDLGVGAAFTAAGGPYPPMRAWRDGEPGERWDLAERTGPIPGAPYHEALMVPQWRTQELLYARVRELGGEAEFGAEVAGLAQDAEGVTVRLADGRAVRGRYLVAADGGRSTVRRELGIAMHGETVDPSPMLVADVRLGADAELGRDAWHVWPEAPGGSLALCPLAGVPEFQLAAQFAPGTEVSVSAAAVRSLISSRTGIPASAVQEVRWASDFTARAAMAERFREGRVFLAGDAAHVHSPAGGQGLNTGVQDAYNLGWKLGEVLRGAAGEELLDSYAVEREAVAADVLGLSTRIHRGVVRRGSSTHQLDVGYRSSPLSRDLRAAPGGWLRPGDRAPDAECVLSDGTPVRIFDLLHGTGYVTLSFGGTPPPGSYAITKTEPHAEAAYGPDTYTIRPDGYISVAQ